MHTCSPREDMAAQGAGVVSPTLHWGVAAPGSNPGLPDSDFHGRARLLFISPGVQHP